jgi:hypothetical protein
MIDFHNLNETVVLILPWIIPAVNTGLQILLGRNAQTSSIPMFATSISAAASKLPSFGR